MPWAQPRSVPGLLLVNKLQWKRGHRSSSAYGNPTLPIFNHLPKTKRKAKQNTETIPSIPSTGRKWLPSLPLHITDTFSSATVEPTIHQLHCFWPWIQLRAEEPRNHIIQFGWWVALRLSIKMLQANKPHLPLKSDLPAAPETPISKKLVLPYYRPCSLLPQAVFLSSSSTSGHLPMHVPTSQRLCTKAHGEGQDSGHAC